MTPEEIMTVLKDVNDPEYPVSIVDLGLVRGVEIEDGTVKVRCTFTSTGCPCMDWIKNDIKERLLKEPNIESVVVEDDWSKPWTSKDMSEKAIKVFQSLNTSV
ncbi:benzoyl-CoA oxygenase [Bacillus sp. M6-12]|uniref:metal-sulfur cluster assembly factor n=1 Tax=Bacillus sp. M6-12 TaxID=2054166 RepID=UPI000C75F2E3|nr:metal-sulfur cluster assembly factor [Bacillus sp. M6-12]PLS18568.1 benzoyl-CoA oxygenase [Bacillus sp. M6-12]